MKVSSNRYRKERLKVVSTRVIHSKKKTEKQKFKEKEMKGMKNSNKEAVNNV
jgi:hypothetical protein